DQQPRLELRRHERLQLSVERDRVVVQHPVELARGDLAEVRESRLQPEVLPVGFVPVGPVSSPTFDRNEKVAAWTCAGTFAAISSTGGCSPAAFASCADSSSCVSFSLSSSSCSTCCSRIRMSASSC